MYGDYRYKNGKGHGIEVKKFSERVKLKVKWNTFLTNQGFRGD